MMLMDNFGLKVREKEQKMRAICEREGILDDYGYQPHHCFFRSEYEKEDWDDPWNIEPVFASSHTGGPSAVHGGNRKLDEKLKNKALARYGNGPHRAELIAIMKKSGYAIWPDV